MNERTGRLGYLALTAALYAVMFVGAATGTVAAVLFPALATYALDAVFTRFAAPPVISLLNRLYLGAPWRFLLRQFLIVVLVYRIGAASHLSLAVVVAAVLAQHVVLSGYSAVRSFINARRLRRLETTNLAVPGAQLPPAPKPWLWANADQLILHTDLLIVAALLVGWLGGKYHVLPVAAVLTVAGALAVVATFVPQVLALRKLPGDERRMRAAQKAILELDPVVVLYHSGGRDSAYQVNMWLQTMERLERRVLVLLRERRYLEDIAPTTAPVLCLPFSVDLMNFQMPSARVGLFVANVGKNIHLLRVPSLKTAFIGHGDSDKTASFNPATKTYDEVWVAGEAGRQRYARAQVGVRADQIVLVGRPQLDAVQGARPLVAGGPFTVLYAPTWEGWTDDPYQTSIISMGPDIVRLLVATPGVRVLFKPHPLTGTVNADATAASAEIVDILARAGDGHESILDNRRALFDCFNESDALISDISSVVSDYLKSEKPYFVTNGAGLPAELFRRINASAGAAHLIGPGTAGLPEGLADARGPDTLRARRASVRTFLLGPPELDPMTAFRDAIDRLAAGADARLAAVSAEDIGTDEVLGIEREESPHHAPRKLHKAEAPEDLTADL